MNWVDNRMSRTLLGRRLMERLFGKVMTRPAPRMIGKGLGSASAGSITFWIHDPDSDPVDDRGFEQMFSIPPPFFYGPHGSRPAFSFTRRRVLRQRQLNETDASPTEDTSLPAIRRRNAIKDELSECARRINGPIGLIRQVLKAVYIELERTYPAQDFYVKGERSSVEGKRSTVAGEQWLRTQLKYLWQSIVEGSDTLVVLSAFDELLSYVDGDSGFGRCQREAVHQFLLDRDRILSLAIELEDKLWAIDGRVPNKRGRRRDYPQGLEDQILNAWHRAWLKRTKLKQGSQAQVREKLFSAEYDKIRQEYPTLPEKPPSIRWLRETARACGRDFAKKE